MKYGVCGGLDLAKRVLDAGFDFLEVGASGFALREDFDAADYREGRVEASNLFFPGTVRLFGAERTPYLEYSQRAVDRAHEIGIGVMVIGSGNSRRAPQGIPLPEAERLFVEIVGDIADYARGSGIVIAPESLNRSETNVGNDLGQLAVALRNRGVGYTADSYHVLFEWDADGGEGEPDWEAQIPFSPSHVHVGDLPRNAPEPNDPHMKGFANRLRTLGYDGRISLEARRRDESDAELRRVLANLKEIFG
ncbi:MAG: sugar phosphate isomerase/epimerase family protein [Fimbriimonas sp.]